MSRLFVIEMKFLFGNVRIFCERKSLYGLTFSLSLFHRTLTSLAARSSLATYERDFRPSAWESEPRTMVAIAGICAETGDRAREIAASAKHTTVPLSVVGTPNEWCDCVAEIVSDTGAQEIMYLDASPLPEQRLRSLELTAEALNGSDATRPAAATRPPESVYSFSGPA
jgi:hypothetical protein